MIKLRDYQEKIFNEVCQAVQKGYKSILIVLPCRAGKTPLATYITRMIFNQGGAVLFYVHRKILVKQTSKTFTQYNLPHGVLSPQHTHTDHPLQIGTIGTVYNRLDKIRYPNLLISDEAHRDRATTREYIIRYYEKSIKIGLTATPIRLSGESLGDIYDIMIQGPSVEELINGGWLCDFKLYCPPSQIDTSNIKKTAGDYNRKELSKETNKVTVTGDAIEHYKKIIPGKQVVIFCVDIQHAIDTANKYNNEGIKSLCLHSKLSSTEQDTVVELFVSKNIQVITNVDMITEGYDCPGIEAVQILRKTQSLALHIQMCTRPMTPSPGKKECFILDHVGNTEEHGTVDADFHWTLESGKKKMVSLEDLADGVPLIKVCKECWYTYASSVSKCPCCGATSFRPPTVVQTIDAELLLKKTINGTVRHLVGDNKIQGLNIPALKERLEIFQENYIPSDSKHYIKVLKRLDTLKAKSPQEILEVATKWGYNLHWCASRYLILNRLISKGQAYSLLKAACQEYKLQLRK